VTYQRNDDLAVGMCLEVICVLQMLSDETMVIDLAVDSQNNGVIGVGQGLGARLCEEESMISHDERREQIDQYSTWGDAIDSPTPTMLRRSWHRTRHLVREVSQGITKPD
jgi:hypothetical protein